MGSIQVKVDMSPCIISLHSGNIGQHYYGQVWTRLQLERTNWCRFFHFYCFTINKPFAVFGKRYAQEYKANQ